MSQEVRNLEPKALWNHFADLNSVPRPSKKEEKVIAFVKKFGEDLGLPTMVDEVGNVIIKKPASAGMEGRTTIILQSHIDMVCQKNNDTVFDFDTQGIDMFIEGDWVKARGTTLGADNGLGVASIMTVLKSTDIAHPPIEALFTIDEETGMTGAKGLKGGVLDGKILLNLDTEDDDELTIGCAGGIDVTAEGLYIQRDLDREFKAVELKVKGLSGGHSGMDIHLGKGNANKLLNRILWGGNEGCGMRVASIDGGGLRNAIPREAKAIIAVPAAKFDVFERHIAAMLIKYKDEFKITDPDIDITYEPAAMPTKVMDVKTQENFLSAMYACPLGIYRMSPEMEGLVQTSNNIARVVVKDGEYNVQCLTRGSVESEKMDLAQSIEAAFILIGANVTFTGEYPGWEPLSGSDIVNLMSKLYEERFNEPAKVSACHAGLECGILGTNYPDVEMISFGPNIKGAHSPDERTQISSVQKYWGFFLETLKAIQ